MSRLDLTVDLTLETVEFKFASIVGELCGKPSVLSQFAVWLDLRLAEYKANGAFQLDCTGFKPNPVWLSGLREGSPRQNVTPPPRHVTPPPRHVTPQSQRQRSLPQRHIEPQITPNKVVVKREPRDFYREDNFATHFIENNSQMAATRTDRKRLSDNQTYVPAKSRRVSTSSTRVSQETQPPMESSYLQSNEQSMSSPAEITSPNNYQVPNRDNDLMGKGNNSTDFSFPREDNPPDLFFSASLGEVTPTVLPEGSELKSFTSADPKTTASSETDLSLLYKIPDDPLPRRFSTRQAAEKARMFLSQMVSDESENEDDAKNEADEEKSEDSQFEAPCATKVTDPENQTEQAEPESSTIIAEEKESDTSENVDVTAHIISAETKATAVEQVDNDVVTNPAPDQQPETVTPPSKRRGRPPKARQTLIKLPPPKLGSSKKSETDEKGSQAASLEPQPSELDPQQTELVEDTSVAPVTKAVKGRRRKKAGSMAVRKKKASQPVAQTDAEERKIPLKRGRKPKASITVVNTPDISALEAIKLAKDRESVTPEMPASLIDFKEQTSQPTSKKINTFQPQKLKKGKTFRKKQGSSVTATLDPKNRENPPILDRVDTPTFQIENVRTVTASPSPEKNNGAPVTSGSFSKGSQDKSNTASTTTMPSQVNTTASMMPPKIDFMTSPVLSSETRKTTSQEIIIKQEGFDENEFSTAPKLTQPQHSTGSHFASLTHSPIIKPGADPRGTYLASPGPNYYGNRISENQATRTVQTSLRPETAPVSQMLTKQQAQMNPTDPMAQRGRQPGNFMQSPPSAPIRTTHTTQRLPLSPPNTSQQTPRHQYSGHFSTQTSRMLQTMNKYSPPSQSTGISHHNVDPHSSPRMSPNLSRFSSDQTSQPMPQTGRFSSPRTAQPDQIMSLPGSEFRQARPQQKGQFTPQMMPQALDQVSASPTHYTAASSNQLSQPGQTMSRMASSRHDMPPYSQMDQWPTGRPAQTTNRFSSFSSQSTEVPSFHPTRPSRAPAPRMSHVGIRMSSPTPPNQVVSPRPMQPRQSSTVRGAMYSSPSHKPRFAQTGQMGSPRMTQVRHQAALSQARQPNPSQVLSASGLSPSTLTSQAKQPMQSASSQMSSPTVTATSQQVEATSSQSSQSSLKPGKASQGHEKLSSKTEQGKASQISTQGTAASQSNSSVEISAHIRKEMSMFRLVISKHVRKEVSDDPSALVKILALYRSLSNQPKDKNLFSDQEVDVLTRINSDLFPTPTSFLEGVIMQMVANFSTCILTWSDHMALLWGDVELVTEGNQEYILYTGKCSKPISALSITRARDRKAYQRPEAPGRCPVIIYKEYLRLRPAEANKPMSPFYLTPNRDFVEAFSTRVLEDKSFSLLAALVKGKAKKVLHPEHVVEIND